MADSAGSEHCTDSLPVDSIDSSGGYCLGTLVADSAVVVVLVADAYPYPVSLGNL